MKKKMKDYCVSYTFGAVITVEASSEEEAQEEIESMNTSELLELAEDGFTIQDVYEEKE
jgi:hypothetical protein